MIFGSDSNKIVKKWENYGFLENAKYPEKTAFALEKIVNLFLNNDSIKKLNNYDHINTMIFSIVYRLINHRDMVFDTIELTNLIVVFNNEYNNIRQLLEYSRYSNIDIEAEFCANFNETYTK